VRALAVSLLALLFLGACGSGEPDSVAVSTRAADEPSSTASPGPEQLYEANAIVIEAGEGPMLCVGAIQLTLPPRCGDVPIANWDWDAVPGEESMSGTTYGNYRVVGTYDGEVFSVTETGLLGDSWDEDIYRAENPCQEPEGGWVADPDRHTQEHDRRAQAYARSQPDYVSSFVDHLDEELAEFSPVVVVAVFTGDRERHEAEIREVWDGPLCVVERDVPTAKELARIRAEVEGRLPELGLVFLGSGTGGFPPTIYIDVLVDVDGRAQALVNEEYGSGIVRFLPALRPVR
jgi:hypothetical protein